MNLHLSLASKTFIGMILGGILGIFIGPQVSIFKLIGDVFIKLLQMALVPLVFFSVISAIANIGDIKRLGRIGGKTIAFFILTSGIASILGIVLGSVFSPGVGITLNNLPQVTNAVATNANIGATILNMIPSNIFKAMADANMVQVIVFAVFSGIAIILLKDDEKKKIINGVNIIFQFIMKVLGLVISLSPYGVFALMVVTVGQYGAQVIGVLTNFIVTIYAGIFLQLIVVLAALYTIFVHQNPYSFFKQISPIWVTSISTCSTRATMPTCFEVCEKKLHILPSIFKFIIPLGASANMNGNALWFSAVGVFISQLVGISLSPTQYIIIAVFSVVMTLSSPGLPGGIVATSAVFLTTMGLPIEVIGLLAGIFRVFDIGLTTLNVLGTIVVTAIVNHGEQDNSQTALTNSSKSISTAQH